MSTMQKVKRLAACDAEQIRKLLIDHESELRALGVGSLALFGSVARGAARADSDVDVAVRLVPSSRQRGFAYLGQLQQIEDRIRAIVARDVDVIEEPADNARVQAAIDRDRVHAF